VYQLRTRRALTDIPCVSPHQRETHHSSGASSDNAQLVSQHILFKMGQPETSTELDDFHFALAQAARSFLRNHDGITELRGGSAL
jgi:hypothetical protein